MWGWIVLHLAQIQGPTEVPTRVGMDRLVSSLTDVMREDSHVCVGMEELNQEKLAPLLRLRCHNSIADTIADPGKAVDTRRIFSGFQKCLYRSQAVA